MNQALIRRFRAEIRERNDISPNAEVSLDNDPKREANTALAKALLEEVFHGRITVTLTNNGIVCGSREEAAGTRLTQYTTDTPQNHHILLSSLTKREIETLLKERRLKGTVFVPDTPEVRMLDRLAQQYEDVLYGA